MTKSQNTTSRPAERAPRRPFDRLPPEVGPNTRLIAGARRPERNAGAIVPPIYQTSTFRYPAEFSESGDEGAAYLYTRDENPSHEVVEELLRQLEGGEAAHVFASGMGGISTTLLTLLSPGDELVALETLYGGTLDLCSRLLPRYGVKVRWVPPDGFAEPEKYLGESTRVVYLESPTNPTLRVVDLEGWSKAAHAVGALAVVDNTFATPLLQTPLALGADLVLHSGTKYLGGHADLMAGAVVGPADIIARIHETYRVLGSVLDPLAAFLLLRGMRTLGVRVERQSRTAEELVERLADHPAVRAVLYPGRASPAEGELVRRQMRARGGMFSLVLRGGDAAADRFLRRLRLVEVASSLGGVESLVSLPKDTSHRHFSATEREARGIPTGTVRLSVGLEDPQDLLRDLSQALGAR